MFKLSLILSLLFSSVFAENDPQPSSAPADPQTVGNLNATGLVAPTNQSANLLPNFLLEIKAGDSQLTMSTDLSAMTAVTGKSFSSVNGITSLCFGTLILMNSSSNLDFNIIPMVPCDDAELVAEYLVTIEDSNSPCAVLYSLNSQGCQFTSISSTFETQLGTVFTMTSSTSSKSIVSQVDRTSGLISATISPKSDGTGSGTTSSKSSGSTVAMAILYSITGVVASAILFIIVSGAIRVHKHPERYGLVSINSTYDQGPGGEGFGSMNVQYANRARGLARAVLDSIPLVRFQVHGNETADAQNKEENIGVGNSDNNESIIIHDGKEGKDSDCNVHPLEKVKQIHPHRSSTSTKSIQPMETLIGSADEPDCPICFESFKDGDILRVLPCKHRFHALCVDPWLLNSSALCPLCRVDLSLEAADEQVSNRQGLPNTDNNLTIPPDYEVEISLFNRLLDVWNAQLLPRDARRAALTRFHEEAELRRQLRARQGPTFDEQNRRRWINFVDSRRILHQLRHRRRTDGDENINNAEELSTQAEEAAQATQLVQPTQPVQPEQPTQEIQPTAPPPSSSPPPSPPLSPHSHP